MSRSAFDKLLDIIGDDLGVVVMRILGGQTMRVRKRNESVTEMYLRDQAYYDSLTVSKAAKALGCQRQMMWHLRRKHRKIP